MMPEKCKKEVETRNLQKKCRKRSFLRKTFTITVFLTILNSIIAQAEDISQPNTVQLSTGEEEPLSNKKQNSTISQDDNSTGRVGSNLMNNNDESSNDEELLTGRGPEPGRGFLIGSGGGAAGGSPFKLITKVPSSSTSLGFGQANPSTSTTTGPTRQVRQTNKRRTTQPFESSTTSMATSTTTTTDDPDNVTITEKQSRKKPISANNNKLKKNIRKKNKKKNEDDDIDSEFSINDDDDDDVERLDDINTDDDDIKLKKRKKDRQPNSTTTTTTSSFEPSTSASSTTSPNDGSSTTIKIATITNNSTSDSKNSLTTVRPVDGLIRSTNDINELPSMVNQTRSSNSNKPITLSQNQLESILAFLNTTNFNLSSLMPNNCCCNQSQINSTHLNELKSINSDNNDGSSTTAKLLNTSKHLNTTMNPMTVNNFNDTIIMTKQPRDNMSHYLPLNKHRADNSDNNGTKNNKSIVELMKDINEDHTKLHNNVQEQASSLRKFIITSSICVVIATSIAVAIIVFFLK